MNLQEVQVDRLVGPTHHFGGLGVGNLASQQHSGQVSNPAAAALQGLDKMRLVAGLGAVQVILPPQPRPDFRFLRSLGFAGSDADVLRQAYNEAPGLLSAATSCSAMWTANAATVTPGVDSDVESSTVTIANLDSSLHRAIEPQQTASELRRALPEGCCIIDQLPGGAAMRDEGAANHMRLGITGDRAGMNVLVYGDGDPAPSINWPRQSRAACEAIARLHALPAENTFLLRQHPTAVDAGAFHNDVVAMSHQKLLIHHELAFIDEADRLQRLERRFAEVTGEDLIRIEVPQSSLSIEGAVNTYLFNSQIVTGPTGKPVIVCTSQVRAHADAQSLVEQWCESGLFAEVHYVDLTQSMSGGGGPACLRLRVPMAAAAVNAIPSSAQWSEAIDAILREVIAKYYVAHLTLEDLSRVEFHEHAQQAFRRIAEILA
jgi:succinylarginine dihydrolase